MIRRARRHVSLATRIVLAATVSVAAVVVGHGVALRATFSAAVDAWEAERLGSTAHHIAEMISRSGEQHTRDVIAGVREDYGLFGDRVEWLPSGRPGRGPHAVAVAVDGAPGVVRVSAPEGSFEALDRRLSRSHLLLLAAAVAAVLVAVQVSVHWGLRRPLARVRKQLRRMRRGRWTAEASPGGAREISELAGDLESVGRTLEESVTMWVEAERRASYEGARLELRQRLVPHLRELNLVASDLTGRGAFDAAGVRRARRMLRAADTIVEIVGTGEPAAPG